MGTMHSPLPIIAHGEAGLYLMVGVLFVFGAVLGLVAGLRRHPIGYPIGTSMVLAALGYMLIGWWGLLTPLALALSYLWGRYA
jgi:hypothetical protein